MKRFKVVLLALLSAAVLLTPTACSKSKPASAASSAPTADTASSQTDTTSSMDSTAVSSAVSQAVVSGVSSAAASSKVVSKTTSSKTTAAATSKTTSKAASTVTAPPVTLTISAAASLTDVLTEIQGLYKTVKPNVTLQFNFGASGTLQTQIEQGAPADVFISAAAKQMDALQNESLLVNSTRKDLLRNRLVLIVPNNSQYDYVTSFADMTSNDIKVIAIGDTTAVPAGQYAVQTFKWYNIYDMISTKFVYGKDVRSVLNYVETGNADAGVVYETDAKTSSKVKIVAVAPEASHTPVIYPEAVLKNSANQAAASDFLSFLSSQTAKSSFTKYGFTNLT